MRVVQLFGRERSEAQRFDALNRDHLDAHLRSITVYALYFPVIEVLTSVALASLIVAGAHRVGIATLITWAPWRRFSSSCAGSTSRCRICPTSTTRCSRRWRRRSAIFRLLDTKPDWRDAGEGRWRARMSGPASRAPSREGVTVEFEDVWFAYDLAHWRRVTRDRRSRSGCCAA